MDRCLIIAPIPNDQKENGASIPLPHIYAACQRRMHTEIIFVADAVQQRWRRALAIAAGRECVASSRWDSSVIRDLPYIPSVVVSYLGSTARLALLVPAARRLCVVQDSITGIVDSTLKIEGAPSTVRRLAHLTNARYERLTYSSLDGVQVTTDRERRMLQHLGIRMKILVNPNGVELPPAQSRAELVYDVCMFADFRNGRNVAMAHRGIRLCESAARRSGQSLGVIIAGWGASSLHFDLDPAVTVTPLDGADNPDAVLRTSVAFLCLDESSTGIKNSVLRLLSLGIPGLVHKSVAEPIAGREENRALRVVTDSLDGQVEQLLNLLRDGSTQPYSRAEAHSLSRRFSWSTYERRFTEWAFESVPFAGH